MTKIFTRSYNPWIMGGKCNSVIAITIPDPEWVPIGFGFEGAVVIDPHGKPHVIERISGGVIGQTLDEVRRDIETCGDFDYMLNQVKQQKRIGEDAPLVSPEVFWDMK